VDPESRTEADCAIVHLLFYVVYSDVVPIAVNKMATIAKQ
jgi:hypothetical protein